MAPFLVSDYSDVANLFSLHQGCSPACGVDWEEGEYGFVFTSLSHLTDLARLFLPGKYHTKAVILFTRARHILPMPVSTNLDPLNNSIFFFFVRLLFIFLLKNQVTNVQGYISGFDSSPATFDPGR